MIIHKRIRLTPIQRREMFDKYFNKEPMARRKEQLGL
ncbi:MAG: hypothetical protein US88_C0006G0006 [Parcubacteria group bacterium GW2011_GWA2_38_27]|nr:MAG: hypothetical protein US88_C0006G0006 [Parcubacteria group bacterium GW2011_GWA2_38_27]